MKPDLQNLPNLQLARDTAKKLVRTYFKNDSGSPFEMTDSQSDIFLLVFLKLFPRNVLLTYTQFGKTDTVSMALILRTQIYKEMFTIVAGKKSKGMLIMNKVIQHTFDHKRFYMRLEIDQNLPLDRLKRERSKEKITWLGGGGVRVLSAQTGNRNALKEALIGEGGQNLILEEAPHIPDDVFAMTMRMLIGHKENFLLKIGNAFNRNHYFKSWHSDKYAKIFVDYHKGIAEGRITQEQIDEVKDLPFFSELYECKFPDESDVIEGGYRKLITSELLESAWISEEEAKPLMTGRAKLGGDFAGGGNDRSAYVIRWAKVMKLVSTNKLSDTMQQVPIIQDLIEEYEIEDSDVALDYGGVGQGAVDRIIELDYNVNPVFFGQSAPDPKRYKNARAYMYYELFQWLSKGGKIVKNDEFYELLSINYKTDSERKFQIQPKEELKKTLKELNIRATSPDVADSAALTFADNIELVDEDDFGFA